MRRHKHSIDQSGNNNIAIQDSTVSVLYNPSIRQHLEYLREKGDQKEIFDYIKEVQTDLLEGHPFHPYYRYRLVGNQLKHEATSIKAAEEYPLLYRGKFNISKDQMRGFENMDELFNDAAYKDYGIQVNIIDLNAFIAGQPVENDQNTDTTWELRVKKSLPITKAKLSYMQKDNEISILDYIELSVEYHDSKSNVLTISNIKQEYPITITISIDLNKIKTKDDGIQELHTCNLKIDFRRDYHRIVAHELIFLKVQEALKSQEEVLFKDLINGNIFLRCRTDFEGDLEVITEQISSLKRLRALEKHYNVTFSLPDNISREDEESIEILEKTMYKREISGHFKHVLWKGLNKDTVRNIINNSTDKKIYSASVVYTGADGRIEIFGTTIKIKEWVVFYQSLQIKDYIRVSKKLELMDEDDTISITFLPGDSSSYTDTYSFEK